MKYALLQIGVLAGVIGLVVAVGQGAAVRYWGTDGRTALYAAAVICWIAAVLAAIPFGWAATYRKQHAAPVALAGTGIRLLVTAAFGLAYEWAAKPDVSAFLACILVIYLVALLAETALIVYIVQHALVSTASKTE